MRKAVFIVVIAISLLSAIGMGYFHYFRHDCKYWGGVIQGLAGQLFSDDPYADCGGDGTLPRGGRLEGAPLDVGGRILEAGGVDSAYTPLLHSLSDSLAPLERSARP